MRGYRVRGSSCRYPSATRSARHAIDLPVAVLRGGCYQVLHALGGDATRRRHMSHRLPIAAVEREGGADLIAVIACDLQPVGAPAGVALVDGDEIVVTASLMPFTVTLEQQPVYVHDAQTRLTFGAGRPSLPVCRAAQQGKDGAIAVDRRLATSSRMSATSTSSGSDGRPRGRGGRRLRIADAGGQCQARRLPRLQTVSRHPG